MRPFHTDSRWFVDYWYTDDKVPKPRSLPRTLGRLAVCILVAVGGAAVMMEHAKVHGGSHQPDHARVRFM
jgi:hypothetical protein